MTTTPNAAPRWRCCSCARDIWHFPVLPLSVSSLPDVSVQSRSLPATASRLDSEAEAMPAETPRPRWTLYGQCDGDQQVVREGIPDLESGNSILP